VLNVQRSIIDIPLRRSGARSRQIANLISNAVKYSDSGSAIDVVVVAATDMIEVAVVDHGIGLASEQREWIFELFAQVDTTLERTRGGLGIGLTLARHIVELHAGQLLVQSRAAPDGSRFIDAASAAGRTIWQPASQLTSVKRGDRSSRAALLVVDDNVDAADSLAHDPAIARTSDAMRERSHHKVVDAVDAFRHPRRVPGISACPRLSGYDVARPISARIRLRERDTSQLR
jgi:two-component system CheB/CheR fusion protein